MKANELRVGNWVLIPQSLEGIIIPCYEKQVRGIGLFGGIDFTEPQFPDSLIIPAVHCAGIPLTEEWLKKFGFEKGNNEAWFKLELPETDFSPDKSLLSYCDGILFIKQYCSEGFTITEAAKVIKDAKVTFEIKDESFILKHNSVLIERKIEYVHQLQNFYFVLTGNELTLTER